MLTEAALRASRYAVWPHPNQRRRFILTDLERAPPVVSARLPTHHRTTKALGGLWRNDAIACGKARRLAQTLPKGKSGTSAPVLRFGPTKERGAKPVPTIWFVSGQTAATFGGGDVVTTYRITLRDRATQAVVGYYNGSWTTDRCRAVTLRKREVAEAHAALMRDRTPRNAELIHVEESGAAD